MHSKFISVGLPDAPIPPIPAMAFSGNGAFFGSSHIGSKKEALEMLDLAAKKGIKPWYVLCPITCISQIGVDIVVCRITVLPMKKCGEAVEKVKNNSVRYRYVLTTDI